MEFSKTYLLTFIYLMCQFPRKGCQNLSLWRWLFSVILCLFIAVRQDECGRWCLLDSVFLIAFCSFCFVLGSHSVMLGASYWFFAWGSLLMRLKIWGCWGIEPRSAMFKASILPTVLSLQASHILFFSLLYP